MPTATPRERYYQVLSDSGSLFWILQTLGWFGVSLVTYISLSLPYDQFDLSYLGHNLSQSILGLLLSLPLRLVCRAVWTWPLLSRSLVVVLAVMLVSALWSVLRLLLFMVMTGESGLWGDFGGWLFPSIFVFLTWVALYHGVKYYQLLQREREALLAIEARKRDEALVLAKAQSEARDAQLKLLRYQLNPHFLFNTLNSVVALIGADRSRDGRDMLLRLSTFLRFTLEDEGEPMVSLERECKALRLYLEIEQVRFADRLQVELDFEPRAMSLAVPSLLLQPLVENAIKHAIARSESGGTIRVSARIDGAHLQLRVEDSGPGDASANSVSDTDSGTGIGVSNTRARLANLFGDSFDLCMDPSSLGGLCIRISIPVLETLSSES